MVRVGLRQRGAAMASHSLSIERFTPSGDTVAISTDTPVRPGELIRLLADGSWLVGLRSAFFEISFSGTVTFTDSAEINLNGNAWLDVAAPLEEGFHVVRCEYPDTLLGTHWETTTFLVDEDAAPPPDKPKKGDWLDDLKWILAAVAVIAAVVILAPRILPKQ